MTRQAQDSICIFTFFRETSGINGEMHEEKLKLKLSVCLSQTQHRQTDRQTDANQYISRYYNDWNKVDGTNL